MPRWRQWRRRDLRPDGVLNEFGVIAPAVPVEDLVRALGIDLVLTPGLAASGEVAVHDGQAVIRVRQPEPRTRQRFTIAHELGHLLLHEPGASQDGVWFRDQKFSNFNGFEAQANKFASELLMPEFLVRPAAELCRFRVGALAEMFLVSEIAMRLRMDRLGLLRR